NCRLNEEGEERFTLAGDGSAHLLVLGFESTDHPVEAALERGLELCREAGGEPDPPRGGGAGAWRSAFLRAPYVRDTLVAMGVLLVSFESAITCESFGALHE